MLRSVGRLSEMFTRRTLGRAVVCHTEIIYLFLTKFKRINIYRTGTRMYKPICFDNLSRSKGRFS